MANGASRLFKLMQKSGTDTISEVVYLTVKSLNPLVLNLENRLDITEEFITLSDSILKSKLRVGDILSAFTFNDGQMYFVQQGLNKKLKSVVINNVTSSSTEDSLSANQGRLLANRISALESRIQALEGRIE